MDIAPVLAGDDRDAFEESILGGLQQVPKFVEPRWLYDAVGAKLFEAITNLDHYYLTRTEIGLIEHHAHDIADALGDGVTIIEPGSGEALKVRPLLDALGPRARGYRPIDIAEEQLQSVVGEMSALYPHLEIKSTAVDFFRPFTMDRVDNGVIFFPGSTVGNMLPSAAIARFRDWREISGASRFLIGFDLVKDRQTLLDAYDDPAGITRAFKMNLLQRINRELDGTFDLRAFDFDVHFDETKQAVVMNIVSKEAQTVSIAGVPITFEEGEGIHSEDSRKYTVESFARFAKGASLEPVATWTDEDDYFALMLLETV